MTEKDFIDKLKAEGLDPDSIKNIIEVFEKMKKTTPNMTYDEALNFAIKAHEKNKNRPEGFITVD